VDVVLNSLTGELLHNSLEACSEFGRFIEIGKRDILNHGNLDMIAFGRNISFMAFDLADIFQSKRSSHHVLWQKLLSESMELVRQGYMKPCAPLKVFNASYVADAFKYFALGSRTGKVAVSFEDRSVLIKLLPDGYETKFGSNKVYLMVGCLGGLSRSIAKWMCSRGARNFVFMGRSGMNKTAGRDLVDDLERPGSKVMVVQGGVTQYEDVERAVQAAELPIGGVIQAAMGLKEALWSAMSMDDWDASIGPKIRGTWNLHKALRHQRQDSQLDFFLMTSSISGTVGTATESNYCSANAFLDEFARHRRAQGLPAVSIGLGMISEVGYLHEHPEIERLLVRKGIHSINEDELLQIVDPALASQEPTAWHPRLDLYSNTHILTDIEFIGLQAQRERGFEGDNHVLSDPCASLYAAAFARDTSSAASGGHPLHDGLPDELAKALKNGTPTSILDAISMIVSKKTSNLILVPVDKLRPDKKLGEFGLDSMLAAEFRTYIYHTLEVDLPFMTLLDKGATVNSLAHMIANEMEGKKMATT
jgi:NADP-dependent 3-hydroxy acid dehydrogenase YdfG